MASNPLLFTVLCLFLATADCRRRSHDVQMRHFWQKITDKLRDTTVNKFHIDFRQFDKEDMVLYPDVAFESLENDGMWKVVVHGWRYESHHGKSWLGIMASEWVERLAKSLLSPDTILYLNGSLNHDRLKPFFVDDESNELIQINIGEVTHLLRTDRHGQFLANILLTNDQVQKAKKPGGDNIITYEAIGDNKDKAQGVIRLIEPREGISVISDIDDTIKISEVLDKVRLIANTFIHPFKPVPGKDTQRKANDMIELHLSLSLSLSLLLQAWLMYIETGISTTRTVRFIIYPACLISCTHSPRSSFIRTISPTVPFT